MRAVVLFVLLTVALSASAAPAPLAKRERGAKPSLDGEWTLKEERSRAPRRAPTQSFTMTIRGGQMTIRVQEGGENVEIEFAISTGTGPYPRPIDLRAVRMTMRGQVMKDEERTSLGLYSLEGDVLMLGMKGDGKTRPTSLDDETSEVMVFARVVR